MASNKKVGIIGSGLVGRSWAMLFAGAGYKVVLYDVLKSQIDSALVDIKNQLETLEKNGMLRGKLTAAKQIALISGNTQLKEVVQGAYYIQESVPEVLSIKQELFAKVDELADDNVILASSSSAILPSIISEKLKHRAQFIVAHPVNPPYYVPLVELIPAPWTNKKVVEETRKLQQEIGQSPVTLNREIEGFALNRIQYAILNEGYRLIQEGVISTADMDVVMKDGLGRRYAFLGPFETAHLNAEGIENYFDRYGKTIEGISATFGPNPTYDKAGVSKLAEEIYKMSPMEKLDERRKWRDNSLIELAKLVQDRKKAE